LACKKLCKTVTPAKSLCLTVSCARWTDARPEQDRRLAGVSRSWRCGREEQRKVWPCSMHFRMKYTPCCPARSMRRSAGRI
jgi:hypothetical protein